MGKANRYYRKELVRRISGRGGYYTRHDKFPIEYVVYCTPDLGAESIAKSMVEFSMFENEADLMLQHPDFEEWFGQEWKESSLYEYAQGMVVDDLTNDEGLRMWSPETAKKFGFDYKGKGADRGFDMSFGNYGRGGKHVCIEEFEGVTLRGMSNDDLIAAIEALDEPDGTEEYTFSNVWVRRLLGMLDELEGWLTSENAEHNARYYAASRVAQDLQDRNE